MTRCCTCACACVCTQNVQMLCVGHLLKMVDTPERGLVIAKLVLHWLWQLQALVLLLQELLPNCCHVAHCRHNSTTAPHAGVTALDIADETSLVLA